EFNPLGPTIDQHNPTELPAGDYEVAVFENSFPSLTMLSYDPPTTIVDTMTAKGVCEVVVFTQDTNTSLGALSLKRIDLILQVLSDRYQQLGSMPGIEYVMPFENRGVEVGVTLHHPHCQIYAYPFVPPIPTRELQMQADCYEKNGYGLLEKLVKDEIEDGRRILYRGKFITAFVPVCARYPYEVWIAPYTPLPSVASLNADQRLDFARALKTVLLKYDGLWNRPFPYVMVFHQAATTKSSPQAHLHI